MGGSITLTSQADGEQRIVEIDHTSVIPLWGHVYDKASGDYISALIYYADDFDTIAISIEGDLYYDPANGTFPANILLT